MQDEPTQFAKHGVELASKQASGAARFKKDECGAVTIDWVVLSAALIGMGMLILEPVAFSANGAANKIANDIGSTEIGIPNK